jgi:DNA-binding NtrC family response regulator
MTRVLLIDDQNDVRAVTCTMLQVSRSMRSRPRAAGLKAFVDGRFDVVIVDILLQDAMGSNVIAILRDDVPDCRRRSCRMWFA